MLNYFNHFKNTRYNKFILFYVDNDTRILLIAALHVQNLNAIEFADIRMAQL